MKNDNKMESVINKLATRGSATRLPIRTSGGPIKAERIILKSSSIQFR